MKTPEVRPRCEKHNVTLEDEECPGCHGEGLREDLDDGMHMRPAFVCCWTCGGDGFFRNVACCACEEEDQMEQERWENELAEKDGGA